MVRYLIILLLFTVNNLFAQSIPFYCDKVVVRSGDTLHVVSYCNAFYNPIRGCRDTLLTDEFSDDSLTILPLKIVWHTVKGEGYYRVYSSVNDSMFSSCDVKAELLHGTHVTYFLTRMENLASKCEFRNGQLHGLVYMYNPSGGIWLKERYRRGKLLRHYYLSD